MFNRWNERRITTKPIRIIPAVETYINQPLVEDCSEFFGIGFDLREIDTDLQALNTVAHTEELQNEIVSSSDDIETDTDSITDTEFPSSAVIEKTLLIAHDYTRLVEDILQLGDNMKFNVNYTTLLKSSLCLLANSSNSNQLESTLKSYRLMAIPDSSHDPFEVFCRAIGKDGQENIASLPSAWLLDGSIDPNALRGLVMTELLQNEEVYVQFVLSIKSTFANEVGMLKVVNRGISSNLVNCIPLAICNLLRIQVVIFTGMLNVPVIPLSPSQPAIFVHPVYIAYDGHFLQVDKLITQKYSCEALVEQALSSPAFSNQSACRCGKGGSKNKVSCNTTRCKCVVNGRSCEKCNCSNCGNIFGKRDCLSKTPLGKPTPRKRRRHELTSESKTNHAFLVESKEMLPLSKWSVYENITLIELTRALFSDKTFDIEILCSILTNIDIYTLPIPRTFTIRNRSEISKQVFRAIANDNAYQILLKEQLRMNVLNTN